LVRPAVVVTTNDTQLLAKTWKQQDAEEDYPIRDFTN
jgi:hypothetical protein